MFKKKNDINDDPFVYIEKNALSKEKCIEIIDKSINDKNREKGKTVSGYHPDFKITTDLTITKLDEWKDIDKFITELLINRFNLFKNSLPTKLINKFDKKSDIVEINNVIDIFFSENITGTEYTIAEYEKTKGFIVWHVDSGITHIKYSNHVRLVTFIIYLNDVTEGGETLFLNGKIKPEAGKLIFFPATWTYLHKASIPLSNNKYIISGWIGYSLSLSLSL